MSRTRRKGFDPAQMVTVWTKSRRDWACGNPACCGGKQARKLRRRERALLKAALRRDPEGMSTRVTPRPF